MKNENNQPESICGQTCGCTENNQCTFLKNPVLPESKEVESVQVNHMAIVDQVRTQVEDMTDYVSDFFIKIAGDFTGKNPHVEVQDFANSETRLSCLKLHDTTEAFVIEKRTELNHCEYTFIKKLSVTNHIEVIKKRVEELEAEKLSITSFVGKINQALIINELNHILKLIQ